ncbi:unnamed protein product [Ectocarpus sp. 12 AP-2014]
MRATKRAFLGLLLQASRHTVLAEPCNEVVCGYWWKNYLSGEDGNAWFDSWNKFMQAKLDLLASIAEEREDTETEPFRVLMIGDSTMSHQFGAICGFMGEREGRRFDPEVTQRGAPGCCMDTLPKEDGGEEGGGRGLCFQYDQFRFLDPKRPDRTSVDAYYFGSGLHLLHMYPHWPEMNPMEPLRIQSWLNYESLLEGVVEGVRAKNGQDVNRFHDEPRHRRRAIYRRVQRDSRRLSGRRGERHHPGGVPKRGIRPCGRGIVSCS